MITVNGSMGEGGGQVLRTSLALSAVTGTPFIIEAIRGKRSRPGLLRQHLTAVRAMAEVCSARLSGDELGSSRLTFEPGKVQHGKYQFAVGTAGSVTLVFQTVLPALLIAEGESTIVFEGGTHNAWAPPFDFIRQTFLPLLHRMGGRVHVELEQPGFYPAGGGRFLARVVGGAPLGELKLPERGALTQIELRGVVSQLPEHVAAREVRAMAHQLANFPLQQSVESVRSPGPGNVAMATVRTAHLTETFTAFGERGVRAETVGTKVATEVRKYLSSEAAVGEYLADQLLIPMVLGADGEFSTVPPSLHTRTNAHVIGMFLQKRISLSDAHRIVVRTD